MTRTSKPDSSQDERLSSKTGGAGGGGGAGQEFGAFLRSSREEQSVHLTEVARQTRIPVRSLERLEAGEFDRLPADIFVRGFLRSYAECVGLVKSDVLDRYSLLGRTKAPELSNDLARAARKSRASREDATLLPTSSSTSASSSSSTSSPVSDVKKRRTILPELSDNERESRRGTVTVAVILLVIVATLAMSYLLRRPSADSDGFTYVPNEVPTHAPSEFGDERETFQAFVS